MLSNEEIAGRWRATAIAPWAWTPARNASGTLDVVVEGEAGGLMVTCPELGGRRAYMKPLKKGSRAGFERAAREKIASDLAFDLKVPVPPVVL